MYSYIFCTTLWRLFLLQGKTGYNGSQNGELCILDPDYIYQHTEYIVIASTCGAWECLLSLFFFQIYLFFNLRIIALRNFVVLCQTSAWTRHRYTYVPSLWNLPPVSFPITPSAAAAAAASLQSCPILCYPIDGSPPVSPVPGILQARTLEWVAISFSNAWKWKVKMKSLSCAL